MGRFTQDRPHYEVRKDFSDIRRYSLFLLASLVTCALAITDQSLWIDEGNTAAKAIQASLSAWWTTFVSAKGSDLQMPGYMLFEWGWAKIFGSSEIALRASNIPLFVAGIWALAWGMSSHRKRQTAVVFLALTNAFLWYYLSEARPYIVLFCFASLTAACLFRLLHATEDALDSKSWFRLFCLGLFGLCLTSLIAVPWALGAMVAALYWSGPRALTRSILRFKGAFSLLIGALAILGLYYLWTMKIGARASGVGRTGWSSVAFIFYELFGLAGLGPGRLQLRAEGGGGLVPFVPFVALGGGAVLVLVLTGFRVLRQKTEKRHVVFFLCAVASPLLLTLAAGVSGQMRLLGRHLTPLLPYLLALMAVGLTTFLETHSPWKKVVGWAAVVVFLLSALEIRFAPRHRRDDYRSAAEIAREARDAGEIVWWLADQSTGLYYGVPLNSPLIIDSPDLPRPARTPDLVILSKPDVYDWSGAVRAYLAQNNFTVERVLPAFQIWRPTPPRLPVVKSPGKAGE